MRLLQVRAELGHLRESFITNIASVEENGAVSLHMLHEFLVVGEILLAGGAQIFALRFVLSQVRSMRFRADYFQLTDEAHESSVFVTYMFR